jgi:hypothetical protein
MTSFLKSKLLKMLAKGSSELGAMIQVKLGRPALHHVLRAVGSLGRRTNIGVVKVILTYLATLHRLQKRNGLTYMVLFMKSAQSLLMQSLGGQRLHSLNPLGLRLARTKAGLPRIIPALHRARMRSGDLWTVRLWQTLFGLYRIIEVPGKLKLGTITKPTLMQEWVLPEFSHFVTTHLREALLRNFRKSKVAKAFGPSGPLKFLESLRARPFLVSKSTSAVRKDDEAVRNLTPISSSPAGVLASAILWYDNPLKPFLESWAKMTKNHWILNRIDTWGDSKRTGLYLSDYFDTFDLKSPLLREEILKRGWDERSEARRKTQKFPSSSGVKPGTLGRLAALEEPAGKVRVVAMVDIMTQWLLHPLHEALFELLRRIPTDGTYDQLAPIHRLLKRRPKGPFFSFDLSAATDRIPLSLQKALLSPILTSWGAEAWGCLLVGRPYVICHKDAGLHPDASREAQGKTLSGDLWSVTYGAGQPMGAYSSWAMLAFVHHAIVQWAALRAGVVSPGNGYWFQDYAVLGDDVVIGNSKVATEYQYLMGAIDVPIGDHKSVYSPRGLALEFAKRYFLKGKDASSAPIAEYWAAKGNLPAAAQLSCKYQLTLAQFLTVMGYGFRSKGSVTGRLVTLPRRLRNYVVTYYSPAGFGFKSLQDFFTLRGVGSNYKVTDAKVAALMRSFFDVEIKNLLSRIERLDPLVTEIKALVTVHRDREHYGAKPRGPDRQIVFRDLLYHGGWHLTGHVVDSIKETVYREAFWDTLIKIRDLRNQLEELSLDTLDWGSFEKLLDTCREIDTELGLLPLPRDLYVRKSESSNIRLEFSWSKVWDKYSTHFRTTSGSAPTEITQEEQPNP